MAELPIEQPEDWSVLVVEDEPRLREMLLRAIPDMGFQAQAARSAEEALRLMEARPAQLLLLDLNLPGMSGLAFLEVVRQRWPKTAAVILTGFGDLEAARKAIHLDVADFLTKPCPLGDLEVALDRARRRLQPQDPAQAALARLVAARAAAAESGPAADPDTSKARKLDEIERLHILAALERCDGNRTAAARELGISLRTLYYRLAEYQKRGLMPAEE